MKKIMLSSVVICILLVSCFLLSACRTPEFMLYDDVVWYSEDPAIEIFMNSEKWQKGTVNNGTEEIAVEMGWGPGGEFSFDPPGLEFSSHETQLFEGEWVWDKNAKTLTITAIDDKIWNYAYETIVLRYREV